MNHADVEQLLRAVHRLWPTVPMQAPIDADTVRVWQIVLADIPIAGGEAVVVNCARAGDRFPPTPGAIASAYHDVVDRHRGQAVPDVDEAWLEVSTAVQRLGWYSGPPASWSHSAVAAAAAAMTWRELCHGDTMVVRAHFVRIYPAIASRTVAAVVLERTRDALAGIAGSVGRELT